MMAGIFKWIIQLISVILYINTGCSGTRITAVRTGSTAVLPCQINHPNSDPTPYVIEWSRKNNVLPIYIKIGRYPARINAHFKDRTSLLKKSASLRLRDVRLTDEGWYICRILYLGKSAPIEDDEDRNGTWIKLVVTARPAITSAPPPTLISEEGDSLLLRCSIEGKPKPEIFWRKDGHLLADGKDGFSINGGHLSVMSLRKKHRGRYECVGRNSEGQIDYATRVYVKAPPELTIAPKNLTLKEKVDAFFTCKASAYPTNITYSWFYNGKAVQDVTSLRKRYSVISDGTFDIFNVNRYDSGQISCVASNGYGKPVRSSAYLTVQFRARALDVPPVAYGGLSLPVALPCKSEGEPPASIVTWKKNGKVLQHRNNGRVSVTTDGRLLFRNMLNTDEGWYTCTPYNILGSTGESGEIHLIAKEPPVFTYRPQTKIEAEIGKPLSLFCNGKGDPKPSMKWKKIGTDLLESNHRVFWKSGNLTFSSITKSDHGKWQCVLSSPVIELASDVQINVKYTTPHVTTNVTVVTSYNNATISWLPGYDGGYPQHFMIWFKRADQGDHTWSTRSVNGSRKVVVVSRLRPETIYQFAVLAENVLGSGKFSKTVTARTKAYPTESPVRDREEVPVPIGVKYCANEKGLIVISWNTFTTLDHENLLGFLLEYRINHSATKPNQKLDKCDSFLRKIRDVLTAKNTRFIKENNHEIERQMTTIPESDFKSWKRLAAYSANESKVEIGRDKLFQDEVYEIHVLAVTPSAYSRPSDSIIVNTKGMSAYVPPISPETNAAVLSGIVAGILFVLITLLMVVRFCLCRRKYHEYRNDSSEKLNKSSNPIGKSDKEAMKSLASFQASEATSQTATTSKSRTGENVELKQKNGFFRKLRNKFGKSKQPTDALYKQSLINSGYLHGPKETCKNNSVKQVGPIYRSPDGKFHLSDTSNSSKLNSVTHRSISVFGGQNRNLSFDEVNSKNKRKRTKRPVSDTFLTNDVMEMGNIAWTKHEQGKHAEELDAPSLEIDCSQSDIEVRIIANDRNTSLVPPSLVSPQIYDLPVSSNERFSKFGMPDLLGQAQRTTNSGSPFLPIPEYIYLRDIGFSCSETPVPDVVRSPLCLSPKPNSFSPYDNPPPVYPSRYKYYSHVLVPGGHYHLSPGASFASPPPGVWTGPSTPTVHQDHFQNRSFCAGVTPSRTIKVKTVNLHCNQSKKTKCKDRKVQSADDELIRRPSVDPTLDIKSTSPTIPIISPETTGTNNNNNSIPSPGHLSIRTRSHSSSLPTLPYRKVLGSKEKQKNSGKRSASTDDVVIRSDTESDRGFSFASGSASTVRCMVSKESNLTLVEDETKGVSRHLSPFFISHPVSHSEKGHSSTSSSMPSSETGAGSCSGYESQNTSSDVSSSQCMTSRASSFNANRLPKSKHLLRSNHCDRPSTYHQVENPHQLCPSTTIRDSTTSSDESRSRRDNSSVDEKYEWDSESAMESEILEALKNFASHPIRKEPSSNKFLQELQKWRASRPHLASTSTDTSTSLSTNNVFNETVCEDDEDCSLLSPSDSSYSKEKMEKRCALLKKEYFEYKRWLNSQNVDLQAPETHC